MLALAVDQWVPLKMLWHTTIGGESKSCRIKGNINLSGERIYHVPGGKWYRETRINALEGERWFCSEAEARAAGWRRSYE